MNNEGDVMNKVYRFLSMSRPDLVLGKEPTVVRWLFGDTSFLPDMIKGPKERQEAERQWGMDMLRRCRNDLNPEKQWTNSLGEYLAKEIITLVHPGGGCWKPKQIRNIRPDWETTDAIWEVKTGTFFTGGTAHEKIYGCPFKYAEVPMLSKKGVKIMCLAGAERLCRRNGLLPGPQCCDQKKAMVEFYKNVGIEYVGATDLLQSLVDT